MRILVAVLIMLLSSSTLAQNADVHADTKLDYLRLTAEAMAFDKAHNHEQAIATGLKALAAAIREKGPGHERVADMHYNLGVFAKEHGSGKLAEKHYLASLAIYRQHRGNDHPYIAEVLRGLMYAQMSNHDYDEALGSGQRALEIVQKLQVPTATMYSYLWALAENYSVAGRPQDATKLLARCVDLSKAMSPQVELQATREMGKSLLRAGKHRPALEWFRRALTLAEATAGADSPETATLLSDIGAAYHGLDQPNTALPYYEQALTLRKQLLGEDHFHTLTLSITFGTVLLSMGEYERAEALVRPATESLATTSDSEQTLMISNGYAALAAIHSRRGELDQAIAYHDRNLAAIEQLYGKGNPRVGDALLRRAKLHHRAGTKELVGKDIARALAIYRAAFGPQHVTVALAREMKVALLGHDNAVDIYNQVLATRQQLLGEMHPTVGTAHNNLALEHAQHQRWNVALSHQIQCNQVREHNLVLTFELGTESDKQLALKRLTRELDDTLSIHLLGQPDDPKAAEAAATNILQRKGRVVDAIAGGLSALRRDASAKDRALLDELADLRRQLANQLMRTPSSSASNDEQVDALQQRSNEIETELSGRMGDAMRRGTISIQGVDRALDEDTAYVDFIVFQPIEFGNPRARCAALNYGVYVKRKGLPVRGVMLQPAQLIDHDVRTLRAMLSNPTSEPKRAAQRLYRALIAPIEPLIGDAKRIYLSPDGSLNLLPFGALVDDAGDPLLKRWSFNYLSSGRQLLRQRPLGRQRGANVVVAAPDFGPIGKATADNPSLMVFDPLPGAAQEAKALAEQLADTKILTGAAATEDAVKALKGPAVVHIATHGFFLSDTRSEVDFPCTRSANLVKVDVAPHQRNPLLRSGLALAGANGSGNRGEDGVLTALEAASLDLAGTELVVLSACETGVGELRNADGVHGLRRAFEIAGAQTQVMSLWKVDDTSTSELMIGYYDKLRRGHDRVTALRDVQLELMASERTSHPFHWAGFIVSGRDGPVDLSASPVAPPAVGPTARGCGCVMAGQRPASAPRWWVSIMLLAATAARRRTSEHRDDNDQRARHRPGAVATATIKRRRSAAGSSSRATRSRSASNPRCRSQKRRSSQRRGSGA